MERMQRIRHFLWSTQIGVSHSSVLPMTLADTRLWWEMLPTLLWQRVHRTNLIILGQKGVLFKNRLVQAAKLISNHLKVVQQWKKTMAHLNILEVTCQRALQTHKRQTKSEIWKSRLVALKVNQSWEKRRVVRSDAGDDILHPYRNC